MAVQFASLFSTKRGCNVPLRDFFSESYERLARIEHVFGRLFVAVKNEPNPPDMGSDFWIRRFVVKWCNPLLERCCKQYTIAHSISLEYCQMRSVKKNQRSQSPPPRLKTRP